MMKITRIVARTVPMGTGIRNAGVSFAELTGTILAVTAECAGSGSVTGLGFGSIGRYAQTEMVLERFAPRLLRAASDACLDEEGIVDPMRAWEIMMRNEKPGGHGERSVAIGAIDMALWDLAAKARGEPLWHLLSRRFNAGRCDDRVPVYAAGGYYYEGDGLEALRRELAGYFEAGYTAVKIKIGGLPPADDLCRVEAAIGMAGAADRVAVDANGRYDLDTAISMGRRLADLGVRWFEEAGDPLDYDLQCRLTEACPQPFATGENLFSAADVRNLLRYAGLEPERDTLQMDPALSYGLPEYLRMLSVLEKAGWSRRRCMPHGGHQFTLHIAAGLQIGGNESYPGVFQPFGGFGDGVEVCDGALRLPEVPGIGLELKSAMMDHFKLLGDS